jgi:hypothetical protein
MRLNLFVSPYASASVWAHNPKVGFRHFGATNDGSNSSAAQAITVSAAFRTAPLEFPHDSAQPNLEFRTGVSPAGRGQV